MNATTPAYSVSRFIVVSAFLALAFTLAGLPASVFVSAQEPEAEIINDDLAAEQASSTEELLEETAPFDPLSSHPYKVDKLPGDAIYSDFVVGPGRFDLQIAPGESRTVEMIVSNRMGIPKTFFLFTEDMTASDDSSGGVALLGDQVGPYSIKDFISVPQDKFVLQHNERAHVPVTISIPADAEPGGFYGSLLTQIISEDAQSAEQGVTSGSKIVSRIGTLFYVTTPGEIKHEGATKDFSTIGHKKFFSKGPIKFAVVSENTGSVHLRPYGILRILNMSGQEVGYVELQPWYVMPQSVRSKEVEWNREFLAGRYTASVEINRGYDDIVDKISFSFWVIPVKLVLLVFAGFFIFFLLLRFFFSQFEFKRKGG